MRVMWNVKRLTYSNEEIRNGQEEEEEQLLDHTGSLSPKDLRDVNIK